ncbi:hypothetical protein GLOIN_2v1621517 [Rhizophagus clarus]|uniref:Uncharacterized protein n=1 Tax=Rhizophagus clarus TaxID=94130 RepID=A0A8H3L1V1_9GLOM|nr:hypothetical protein GLOIN_2v1621517 [Rhizophagus clarus]
MDNPKNVTEVNNIPSKPLQMVENFPTNYIEWGIFSEGILRNDPPQKSIPLNWKIIGGYYIIEKPAIVFYVIRKGVIPLDNNLLLETINTDVREGFYEPTEVLDSLAC